MASAPTKPKTRTAETSFQEPGRTIPLEQTDKENPPTPSSSSSFEVKTVESSSDLLSDTSQGDSSAPSAAVTTDQEQAQLTFLPGFEEFVPSFPSQDTIPIFSPSDYYDDPDEGEPASSASVLHESEPLLDNRRQRRQWLGSDSPTNLDFPSQHYSSDVQPSSARQLTFMQRYKIWSISVSNSLFIVPFHLALMGLCCFTCYMGAVYYEQCQLVKNLPLNFVLTGGFGIFGLWTRLITVLARNEWIAAYGDSRYATIAAIFGIIACYVSGTAEYILNMNDFTAEPGPGYCHPFFYIYAWWNIWVVLIILIILAVVHGPNSTRFAE